MSKIRNVLVINLAKPFSLVVFFRELDRLSYGNFLMKIERYYITPTKLSYVRGKKPDVKCILCAIRDDDKRLPRLIVTRDNHMIVSLNLHPYSPGHLLIFPLRHLTDIRELSCEEVIEVFRLQKQAVSALEAVYGSPGFCIGFNVGTSSGASIEHLHCHVIPHQADRLELPKMVSSETRLKVEDPQEALKKIREAFAETEKKNSL